MTNGENIKDHKLQYFPIFLRGRVAYWFSKYETTHLQQMGMKCNEIL
jgi:hypothetical protein